MATNSADRVTNDAHAERRLNDLGIQLHEAPERALVSFETDEFAVVAFATDDADNGHIHEAFAAAYQQLTLSLDLRSKQGGQR